MKGESQCRCSYAASLVAVVLSIGAARVAATSPCDTEAWRDTKRCCSGFGIRGPVSETSLSVVRCDSMAVDGNNTVELLWNRSTLQEDGHILDRIFLYSYCINPTNTSQTSKSTILHMSDRSHLRSSTTLPCPLPSSCSYFGCYGANFGYNYYTFSEVSCPMSVSSSAIELSSTNVMGYTEWTTELDMPSSTPLWPTPSTLPSRLLSSEPLKSSHLYTTLERSSTTLEVSGILQTPTVSTPSPSLHNGTSSSVIHLWVLVVLPLVLFMALVAMVFLCSLLLFISIRRNGHLMKKLNNIIWYDSQTTHLDENCKLPKKFQEVDTHSLHSMHTLYEKMFVSDGDLTGGEDEQNVEPSSMLRNSLDSVQDKGREGIEKTRVVETRSLGQHTSTHIERDAEENKENGSLTSSNNLHDHSATSSGISTCCNSTTDFETSAFTTFSSSQCDTFYVPYDGSQWTLSTEINRSSDQDNTTHCSILHES